MFQLSGRLEHLLPPEAYFSEEWYRRERDAVFRPGWHYFCRADEVAADGDRFAAEVMGMPVVVLNRGGELSALQNVCAHRHSKINPDGPGRGARLRCQIHGWEYDETGRLSHLPDGRSFVGLKAHEVCLRRYRAERCGPFVFVSLAPEGPSFEEHLGTFAPEFHRFYRDLRYLVTWRTEHEVNWKIVVENAVESYHVPMVHPKTFAEYRAEELHDHRLEPTYSRYGDLMPYDAEKSVTAVGFRLYTRLLIRDATFARFTHVNVFPNLLLYFGDVFRNLTVVEPLGPEKTRFTSIGFVPSNIRGGVVGRAIQDLSMLLYLHVGKKIAREDMGRWPPVQEGLRRSTHRGVLGAREDRVYAFQEFMAKQMGLDVPVGPGRSAPSSSPAAAVDRPEPLPEGVSCDI